MSAQASQNGEEQKSNQIADPIGEYECRECGTGFKITSHNTSRTKEQGLYFCPMCGERAEGPLHDKTLEK